MSKKKWLEEIYSKGWARKESFSTISGLEVDPLYTKDDILQFDPEKDLGYPATYPYTRGIYSTMYRGRFWTMRQFAGFGTPEDTNKRYKYLLSQGQTGLSVAFHFPTLYGYDSDDYRACGEVGKCGVAIDSLLDMEILFSGIPLDRITTSMTINPPAAMLLSMYLAVAEKQGASFDKVGGTTQNDMLKEFIAQKTWIYPPAPSLKLVIDIVEFCAKHVPKWHPISISGYHIREAGSTATQELAFTLADGIAYVQASIERGLDVDEFAPRLSFFFNSHNDFFEEIAKFRAARRIWAKVMKERFGTKNPQSCQLRFHTQTAGCSLTAQQPYNNIVRTTIQALAAVLGGTQSLHTNSLDETWALPTQEAATIALRTQQIIAEESGVTNIIDPVGGSYYVEWLTNKMEEDAWAYIKKIDEMGGMLKAIELGYPQREITESAYKFQKWVESEEKVIVGVNKYTMKEELPIPTLKIDEEVEKHQVARTKKLRRERNNSAVRTALDNLKRTAEKDENLVYPILAAVKVYATLGEMTGALKEVYGGYQDPGYF